eukprot:3926787-Pleurochrysis_carterae.AAC.3
MIAYPAVHRHCGTNRCVASCTPFKRCSYFELLSSNTMWESVRPSLLKAHCKKTLELRERVQPEANFHAEFVPELYTANKATEKRKWMFDKSISTLYSLQLYTAN